MSDETRPVGRPRVPVDANREKIRELRLEKGLTQEDIADTLGYSTARITQFETGSISGVPLDALKQLAEIFEVDYTELLAEEIPTK